MFLISPKTVPLPHAGASSVFAVWGLPTNFATSPKPSSSHQMSVGIIDYGVPIVDEPMGSDDYVTLPGVRKGLIFDPGETRIFRDPPRSNAERLRDPKVSWHPDMMSLITELFTRAEFEGRLLDGEKIAEMIRFLKDELGHPIKQGVPSILLKSRELTLLAMKKYIEIFGFFPSISDLRKQGLNTLHSGMRVHGGCTKIMRELGAQRPRFAASNKSVRSRVSATRKRSVPPKTITTSLRKIEMGNNFIAIDNGYHPPWDVRLVMKFMNSHDKDRMKWESERGERQAYVALVKDKLWIPVQADPKEKRLFFRKKDIPALLFVAKVEYGSREVVKRAIMELRSQANTLDDRSPPWLQLKMWAAKRLSDDLPELEVSLRPMLSKGHVKYFFCKTWEQYSKV